MTKNIAAALLALAATHALPQTWSETFEAGSKGTYAAGDVSCVMGAWHLADGLLGASASDRYFGTQAVRLRTGKLEMIFDKTNGVDTFSGWFAKYGTDGDSAVTVECSTDGSNTWFRAGEDVAVTSAALTRVAISVRTNGNVRFRISKEGTGRINIDNIAISDFGCGPVPPEIAPVAEQRARVGQTLSFALAVAPTDGDPVTATNVAASAGVTGAWGLANGVFSFTPLAADIGMQAFTFTAEDKDGTSQPVEVTVRVRDVQTAAVRMWSDTGRYAQSFDALAASGSTNEWDNAVAPLPAWYAYANAAAVESYRAGTGSGSSGGVYAFGTEGSTNRALGSLAGSGATYRYGVALTNETGFAISNLTVSFFAMQWRVANGATNTLVFDYCVTNGVPPLCQGVWTAVPALCFDSPVVTNGGQAAGAVCVSETRCAALGEPVPAGKVVTLRWRDPDDAGSDHAFGIDDLVVTWAAQRMRGGTVLTVY